MSNTFSTTSSTGFFGRMKNALVGILLGFLAIPGSVILMGWNEYRSIQRVRTLKEGLGAVQRDIDVSSRNNELEGKLVHFSAVAETDEELADNIFQIGDIGIKLRRRVEMYQWVEHEESESKSRVGGSRETKTTYTYETKWSEGYEDSSQFAQPEGHSNPQPAFDAAQFVATNVHVGAYQLSKSIISSLNKYESIALGSQNLAALPDELRERVRIDGDAFYFRAGAGSADQTATEPNDGAGNSSGNSLSEKFGGGAAAAGRNGATSEQVVEQEETPAAGQVATTGSPQVGDLRIRFQIVRPQKISVVSQIAGNTFQPYQARAGKLELVEMGQVSADQMFQHAKDANATMTWLLRLVGFVVCGIGFSLILGPVAVLGDVIPFIGGLARGAIFLVSMLLALVISSLTIAISWIAVRPLVGIPLLLVAAGGIAGLFVLWSKSSKAKAHHDDQVELV